MELSLKNLLAVAIVASIASSAFALHCYHCESTQDKRCGENFESDEHFKVDCAKLQQQLPQPISQFGPFKLVNATGCLKRLFDYQPNQPRFQRTCFYGNIPNGGNACAFDPTLPTQKLLSCDICTGELCNGSSALAPIGFAVALFIAVARLLA